MGLCWSCMCSECLDEPYPARQNDYIPTRQYSTAYAPSGKPQFGEFKCRSCGRKWKSLRSWPNSYQMCKGCKSPTYPFYQREICTSDMMQDPPGEAAEHPKELCQKCIQLGHSCARSRPCKVI